MLHRKMWEWLFIAEALRERGLLAPGRSGLGFGVGQEPLVALFADAGCDVVATDQPHGSAVATGWTDSELEWAGGLENLNPHGLCPDELFVRRFRYRAVDMNAHPHRPAAASTSPGPRAPSSTWGPWAPGRTSWWWPMACLRPGGVAVHTTEFLVSSEDDTVEAGGTVFYRRRDIEALVERLRRAGHDIDMDYRLGDTPEDRHVDVAPYTDVHLRTQLAGYVTTSVALVVTKGAGGGGRLASLFRRTRG